MSIILILSTTLDRRKQLISDWEVRLEVKK